MEQWNSNSTQGARDIILASQTVHEISTQISFETNITFNTSLFDKLEHLYRNNKKLSVEERAGEVLKKPTWTLSFLIFILGLLANSFTIQAIMNIPKHHRSAHLKFIISLACSDTLILIAIFCGDIIYIFSSLHSDCTRLLKTLMLDVPLLATLLNLLAMALDHYLASFRQLHYPHLMTRSRGNYVICCIWLFSVASALTEFVIGIDLSANTFGSFCMAIAYDSYNIEQFIVGTIFVVLLFIILIYIRMYIHVRRSLPGRSRHKRQSVTPSLKTLVTTILFIGTFVFFWTPEGIFQIYMYLRTKADENFIHEHFEDITQISDILFLILQLNSLADPIIYAIRLPKVQQGLKTLFCKKVERDQDIDKCNMQLKQTNVTNLTCLNNLNKHI
ncbi:melanocortin receptor 5-like [Mercenaria mercenaria]|uniref:melanocortin receptor 5-like n=1 Tax=Mercenaria mercenaria TaxID=6596 RepID=UPI00234F2B46|nr:melanocortin receptor 5-like [Mercenaria mercenaria]